MAMMMTKPQAAVTGDDSPGLDEDIAALLTLDPKCEPTADLVGYADTDGNSRTRVARTPRRTAGTFPVPHGGRATAVKVAS